MFQPFVAWMLMTCLCEKGRVERGTRRREEGWRGEGRKQVRTTGERERLPSERVTLTKDLK